MKTKSKARRVKKKVVIPDSDREEHELLRRVLASHEPEFYADLRRGFGLQPHRLEYELATYPEVFEGMETDGRPQIRLRKGQLPTREDILVKRQLCKVVREAGTNGVYLRRLYSNLGYPSKTVERILAGVPEVQATLEKNKKTILYRWTGSKEFGHAQKSPIQDYMLPESPAAFEDPGPRVAVQPALPRPAPEPEKAELTLASMPKAQHITDAECRSKLICLLEKTHRHLDWLENFMDGNLIKRLIAKYPQDFESETVDLGTCDLIIRRRAGAVAVELPAAKLAATDIEMSAPQTGP